MINKAQQQPEHDIARRLAELERAVREIKGVQPLGADVLKTIAIPTVGTYQGTFTLASGSATTVLVHFVPTAQILTDWDFAWSLYIDVNNYTNVFPNGSAFSGGSDQLLTEVTGWLDWADSDDTINTRVLKVRVRNKGASSHTYYFNARAYVPALAATSA